MSGCICGDNRFEIIEAAKKKLMESTNIETPPKEMEVLDNFLFRMWQMGWLPGCKELRNCDVGDSSMSQYNRWELDVRHKCKNECETCNKFFDEVECFTAWSQLPYNKEKNKMSYYNENAFIKNRKNFNVAPYALADAIEALSNDDKHFVDICVTKEDGRLVVMFNRIYKDKMIDDTGCTNDTPSNTEEKTDETTIHNS